MSDIKEQPMSIGDIFSGNEFTVASYQREYAWEAKKKGKKEEHLLGELRPSPVIS